VLIRVGVTSCTTPEACPAVAAPPDAGPWIKPITVSVTIPVLIASVPAVHGLPFTVTWTPAFGGTRIGAPPKPMPRVPFIVKGTIRFASGGVTAAEQALGLPNRQTIPVPWSAIFPARGGPPAKLPEPFLAFFTWMPMIGAAFGSVIGSEAKLRESAPAGIDDPYPP